MFKSEGELSLKGENQKFSAKIFLYKRKIEYNKTNVNKQYNKH